MGDLTEACAKCGYPHAEHSYNGACYGLCGEFVPSAQAALDAVDLSDLWLGGDDGLGPSDTDGALPRPAKGYVTVPLAWLARVRREARSVDQLLVMLVLYRQCLMRRSKTVSLPNTELRKLGVSRQTKYRALAELEAVGALTVEEAGKGHSIRVTLHWFP